MSDSNAENYEKKQKRYKKVIHNLDFLYKLMLCVIPAL